MKRGMLTITGQPETHLGSLHCRQRSASSSARLFGQAKVDFFEVGVADQGILFGHLLTLDLQPLFGRRFGRHGGDYEIAKPGFQS